MTPVNQSPELRVPTCNVDVSRPAHAKGAKAYLINRGHDSHEVLVRSRSGRWIRRWERASHLTNWRYTTVVPDSPEYRHLWVYAGEPLSPLPGNAEPA